MYSMNSIERAQRAAYLDLLQRTANPTLKILDIGEKDCDLLCLDPKSLGMFSYLWFTKQVHVLPFTWERDPNRDGHVPCFSNSGMISYSIDDIAKTHWSLEQLRGIPDCPEVLSIDEAITVIEDCCYHGLFISRPGESIWRSRIYLPLDEDKLIKRMDLSFYHLSNVLAGKAYILDTLYEKELNPSMFDAKLFGALAVIYKYFDCIDAGDGYCKRVYSTLRTYPNLCAFVERLFVEVFGERKYKCLDHSSRMAKDPNFVSRWFARPEKLHRAAGRQPNNHVYKFKIACDVNPFGLSKGTYALKRPTQLSLKGFETEILMQLKLKHPSCIQPIGFGFTDGDGFIILPWKENGSLEGKLDDLKWSEVLTMSRQIAYALHIVHTTALVLGDLKPANILIDDDGSALICDFGSVTDTNGQIIGATKAYCDNNNDKDAVPRFDIYCYGMVLYAMLTTSVDPGKENRRESIVTDLDEGKDILRKNIKECVDFDEDQKSEILALAKDCTRGKKEGHPSTIDILRRLDIMIASNLVLKGGCDTKLQHTSSSVLGSTSSKQAGK